jgi:hypothetical protein
LREKVQISRTESGATPREDLPISKTEKAAILRKVLKILDLDN